MYHARIRIAYPEAINIRTQSSPATKYVRCVHSGKLAAYRFVCSVSFSVCQKEPLGMSCAADNGAMLSETL